MPKTAPKKSAKSFTPSAVPCYAQSPGGKGMKLSCEADDGHEGAVHHATIEREGVHVQRRWSGRKWLDDVVIDGDAKKISTSVDGEPADIVIDGSTGQIKDPKQMRLIRQDPAEITERMRKKNAEFEAQSAVLEDREAAHKAQKKLVDSLQIEPNQIVKELCDAEDGAPKITEAAADRLQAAAVEETDTEDPE